MIGRIRKYFRAFALQWRFGRRMPQRPDFPRLRDLPPVQWVIWRHRWIFSAIVLSALLDAAPFAWLVRSVYSSSAQIFAQPGTVRGASASPGAASGPVIAQDLKLFAVDECGVILSPQIISIAVQNPQLHGLKSLEGVEDPASFIADLLKVEVNPKDDTIHISVDTSYPTDSAKIVNAVVDAYMLVRSPQGAAAASAAAMNRLLDERSETAVALAGDLEAMGALLKRAGVASFDNPDPPVVKTLRGLADSLAAARRDEGLAGDEYRSAAASYPKQKMQADLLAAAAKSPVVLMASAQDLATERTTLANLSGQLIELARMQLPQSPQYRALADQIDQERATFLAMSQHVWEHDKERLAQNLKQWQQQTTAVEDYYKSAADYAGAVADVQRRHAKIKTLDAALLAEKNVPTAAPTITVFQKAVDPDGPSSPNRAGIMGLGLLGGLLLGLIVAYAREIKNPRLHVPGDVEVGLALPVLGIIPQFFPVAPSEHVILPTVNVAGACRNISKILRLINADQPLRTLLITSPSAGDGRSTLARNLAIVHAQRGRRVLLVDGDMRNPSHHLRFALENRRGLTGLLLGRDSLEKAVAPTSLKRLDLLSAGPAKRDPAPLLNFHDLSPIFGAMARNYDLVIVDSPAISAFPDAKLLSRACDATLLLIRAEQTEQRAARIACQTLRNINANVVGVVMNHRPTATQAKIRAVLDRLKSKRHLGQGVFVEEEFVIESQE